LPVVGEREVGTVPGERVGEVWEEKEEGAAEEGEKWHEDDTVDMARSRDGRREEGER
jgi:hypothetical protein